LAGFSRLIQFDKRGVGLSDRVGNPPRLKDTIKDILAVLDATASKRAILCGVSEGGPAIFEFGANYPDRTQALILCATMAKGVRSKDDPFALTRKQYDKGLGLLTGSWGSPTAIEHFAPTRAKDPVLRQWWAEMLRLSASPGSMRMVLEALRDIDVRSCLSKIQVPTLILHRTDAQVIRVQAGRYLASNIPENTYVELDGADHW
jgi:pimeloyl-ACP methyl ester carboxylesterase